MVQRTGEFRWALEVLKLSEAPQSLDGIRKRHLESHLHLGEIIFWAKMMVVEAAMNFARISLLTMAVAELHQEIPVTARVC